MKIQKVLRLSMPSVIGRSNYKTKLADISFDRPFRPVSPDKAFADLLKRQARRVMSDITECSPVVIEAHTARLRDLLEIIEHCIRHEYAETPDGVLSGLQLSRPATLADFAECLKITKQTNRAPAFLNQRDADIAEIKRGINQLAGLIATRPGLVEFLTVESEVES